jgi:hypothetical protein
MTASPTKKIFTKPKIKKNKKKIGNKSQRKVTLNKLIKDKPHARNNKYAIKSEVLKQMSYGEHTGFF